MVLLMGGCGRTPSGPEPATGPFIPRLLQGWTLESVSYEGYMPNPLDTTTQAFFQGTASECSGGFTFHTRNDSDLVLYDIEFQGELMAGLMPIHYKNSGEGIWQYDSLTSHLWFYAEPDTLNFYVDLDAETLQLWHSYAPIRDDSAGIDLTARLDIRLIR